MYRRWLWPAIALPGVLWLVLLFVVPFYAVLGVALGTVDPILFQPVPIWNPLEWNVGWLTEVLSRLAPGGIWFDVGVRTIVYVLVSLALCLLIGLAQASGLVLASFNLKFTVMAVLAIALALADPFLVGMSNALYLRARAAAEAPRPGGGALRPPRR